MKEIIEKLALIEEVQQQLVNKVTAIHSLDHGQQLDRMEEQINKVSNNLAWEKLQAMLPDVLQKINTIPREIPMRHHHHFDLRSKGFVIGGISLLIATAIAIGLCFGYRAENKRLYENDLKFRMIRQAVPGTALWADTVYHRDPDVAEERTKKMEAKEEAHRQAEALAKQKELEAQQQVKEAKKARKEADKLQQRVTK